MSVTSVQLVLILKVEIMQQKAKQKITNRFQTLLLNTVVATSFGLILPAHAQEVEEQVVVENTQAVVVEETPLPLEQIKTFSEVFIRIKNSYVEPVSDEKLIEYAIKGMLDGLDPHSAYLKQEKYDTLNESATGKFGGLGMEVVLEDGFVKVVAPIDDTPAYEAGIESGDVIIRIDGEAISGGDLRSSTNKMRGDPGTSVTLTIVRETETEPFDITLKRAIIKTKSVKRMKLSDRVGYLRVSQFQAATAENFRSELKKLREEKDFSGLIIDLRNNPGGLLNSAISISDIFLSDGVIVSTKGRVERNNKEYKATGVDTLDGMPIVVIINGGSASASEIVAGALQDHKRALILGTDSFGKGSVQSVLTVSGDAGLKLTTARYYTPSGASIQASGIVPDVYVEKRKFQDPEKGGFKRFKENDLPGHLENDSKPTVTKPTEKVAKLLAEDYQLNEAYNLLNGLILFK